MTVVEPPADNSGTIPVQENSSVRPKRKRVHDFDFQCPCDRCEGQPPVSYTTVSAHIAKLAKRIKTNVNSKAITEAQRARILELSDRINAFKGLVKSGTWREVAIEKNVSHGDQVERNQPDTNANVGTETHGDVEDYYDMFYEDGGEYDDNQFEYEGNHEDDSGSDVDAGSDTLGKSERVFDLNAILDDANTDISFEGCTKPEDLAPWLLDTVVERPNAPDEPKKLVGDFCVAMVMDMLRSKYAMQNIACTFNTCSRFIPNVPSYNKLEALVRRIGSPFQTFFTCINHHKLACERGVICGKASCGKPMDIQIKQLKIMDILRRAMQDKTFSDGVRYGPGIGCSSDGTISSVWQSKAMDDLKEKVGYDMQMTDDYIPIVIELFTDGFAPYNKSNYSIWCVLMRILNLPPELGKMYDNIYPLIMIDGPKEPQSIDQYLGMIVKDIEESCSNAAGSIYDAAMEKRVSIKVFLLCSAQDTRALRLVAKHDETPSQYPCHMCQIEGENFSIGKGKGMQRVAYKISSLPDPSSTESNRVQWSHSEVKTIQKWVESMLKGGETLSSIAQNRKGIRGVCAFQGVEYFDLVKGFLFCAMHGIQNAASRAESNVIGKYDTQVLRTHLKLKDKEKAKWVMDKAPKDCQSRRSDPKRYSEKNYTQARNYVSFIHIPSGFHGDPSRLFRKPNASKRKREEENESNAAKIKASEWKDFAVSGIMCAAMYFGGVDPDVVRAYDGLFYAIKQLCSPVVKIEEIQKLDDGAMYQIMLDLENRLPAIEMPFHLHSLYHLPQQVLYYGPLSDLWSFPFESKFKDMKSMAKKKNMPVASMASRISFEMAIGSIAAAMGNHHGEERIMELSDRRLPLIQAGVKLPRRCSKLNLMLPEAENLSNLIRSYYAPSDKLEALIGQGRDWEYLTKIYDLHAVHGNDDDQIAICLQQLAFNRFDMFEYNKISLFGIEIEHRTYVEKRKTRTDNSYLLLRASGNKSIPSLARVENIYRIVIPDESLETENTILDERILLRVKEYALDELDPDLKQCGLQDVFLYNSSTPWVDRLIELSFIQEQAFLSPDMRTIHGSLDEKAKFDSYLVHNKGSLRNVDLSHLSKEMPI